LQQLGEHALPNNQSRDYARNAEDAAADIVYAVASHLMLNPAVNSRADLRRAEAFAEQISAKLTEPMAERCARRSN
jgi:hypothetical protein